MIYFIKSPPIISFSIYAVRYPEYILSQFGQNSLKSGQHWTDLDVSDARAQMVHGSLPSTSHQQHSNQLSILLLFRLDRSIP